MNDYRTFIEVFIDVVHKMRNGEPMMTAKEEFVEDVISDWIECFGEETVI